MDPYFIIFQFDSLFQLLSGISLVLLLIANISHFKMNKSQKEKMIKLDKLIKELEKRKTHL